MKTSTLARPRDEVLTIHLTLAAATRATFQLSYLVTFGGELRTTGVTVHGCTTLTGNPTRLPAWLVELAAR